MKVKKKVLIFRLTNVRWGIKKDRFSLGQAAWIDLSKGCHNFIISIVKLFSVTRLNNRYGGFGAVVSSQVV